MPRKPPPSPGGIVLHQGLQLIETDDPLLLVELAADARLRLRISARLDPCVAVVPADGVTPLIRDLLKAGHLPKVNES